MSQFEPSSSTNSAAIALSGVVKRFGSTTAVDQVELVVSRGETVAILGANGAGKSTTISMILGLLDADAGRVAVLGGSPRQAVTRGEVGAMLQSTGLLPDAKVHELVDLVRGLYPRPLTSDEVVEHAGLADILDRRIDQLSGGQAQRVRLALALAGNPQLLLLDEPTVAMDVETRRTFWERIRAAAQSGRTVVFATHYLAEAEEYADRIVVMAAGKVIADGTAASLTGGRHDRSVRFTPDPSTNLGELHDLPGVTTVEARGGAVILVTSAVEDTLRALLSRFDRLPDLTVSGASLEDAFVALTENHSTEPVNR